MHRRSSSGEKDEKRPLSEVNEKIKHILQKRHLKRVLPCSLLDGRKYEEVLHIFEE